MANVRKCESCNRGKQTECIKRFKAPSNRTEQSHGHKPKRELYSYRCPNSK